jgi:hypothetical protein
VKKLLLSLIFLSNLLHSAAEQPTNKIVRANSAKIAAASYLQANKMRHQQTDLSCSCFGPKFYDIKCLPCLKSQPLPAHIQGKIVLDTTDFDSHKLHYFDTLKDKSLGRIDCPSSFFCCCPCFIKSKIPVNIEIQGSGCGKTYYDKNTNSHVSQVSNSCYLGFADCMSFVCPCDTPSEDDLSN